ncbi:MAG: ribose 5-phosphate isomerase B [Atribacterota bacterium]|nr:ribose 5-phosphate isomerase B [Atribacterota bacterium]
MDKIAIASDHGGYDLKSEIIEYLKKMGYTYKDFGCNDKKSVHYPDYADKVSRAVSKKEYECGILICGTGIGMSIAANKVTGIRASLCHDTFSARMAREHNNANVLTMGGRVIGIGLARDIVQTWLTTDFSQEDRHITRLNKIEEIFNNR